ncbi:hypothetical protein diail_3507 [Diaporthe ilicicola]|nr:hypothetical protein diail_3507 [Diaporthe ilicicola]
MVDIETEVQGGAGDWSLLDDEDVGCGQAHHGGIVPHLQRQKHHQQQLSTPTATAVIKPLDNLEGREIFPGAILASPLPAPSSIQPGSAPSGEHRPNWHTSYSSNVNRRHLPQGPSPPIVPDALAGNNNILSQPHPGPYSPTEPQSQSQSQSQPRSHPPQHRPRGLAHTSPDVQGDTKEQHYNMIFTDLYKSPKSPLSRLRHAHTTQLDVLSSDYDPDLTSKDKTKQKEAVKKHLQSKVRNDWVFTWPPVEHAGSSPASEEPRPPEATEDVTAAKELEGFLEVASDGPDPDGQEVLGEETDRDSAEDADSDTDSVYSTIIEDPVHWRPRLEWASELSDDELPHSSPSPFKFDNPDSIGQAVNASNIAGKTRRRREVRKEAAWNDGLACFEARRNAWTEAKVARARPKPASPVSPSSPRKGFFWRTHTHTSSNAGQTAASPASVTSPLTPVTTANSHPDTSQAHPGSAGSGNSTPNENLSPKTSRSDHLQHEQLQSQQLPVETLLPIAPPLLPPANPMRASITPALYASIYEKVVVHSLQPSCPINLGDMVRACVAGWKRDGEWPPRLTGPEPAALVAVKRRKSATTATAVPPSPAGFAAINGTGGSGRKLSFSLLGGHGHGGEKGRRESLAEEGSGGSTTGKALRRSLQKVLGIGHGQHPNQPVDGSAIVQEH